MKDSTRTLRFQPHVTNLDMARARQNVSFGNKASEDLRHVIDGALTPPISGRDAHTLLRLVACKTKIVAAGN